MDIEQAKRKALERVRQKGLDRQLIAAFVETRHYASWNQNQSNKDWNIGFESIAKLEPKWAAGGNGLVDALTATLDGTAFSLSGSCKTYALPDGITTTQTVWLHFGEQCVLKALYTRYDDGCIPEHFRIFSVEEYHEDSDLGKLLGRISELIAQKKQREKEARLKAQSEQYSGKFTFKD